MNELRKMIHDAQAAQRDLDRAEQEQTIPQAHLDRAENAYQQQQKRPTR
jgi:Skp family chaperone for outer membrane proteins